METGENSVVNLIEKLSNNLTNNNTIQLNGSATTDQRTTIHMDIEFGNTIETKNNTDTQKPNVFELIGDNKSCDNGTNNCIQKTILNNNDLTIGFVDDDDETNGEMDNDDDEGGHTSYFNHGNSDGATKEYENNIGK